MAYIAENNSFNRYFGYNFVVGQTKKSWNVINNINLINSILAFLIKSNKMSPFDEIIKEPFNELL